jgi:hypothetical protein
LLETFTAQPSSTTRDHLARLLPWIVQRGSVSRPSRRSPRTSATMKPATVVLSQSEARYHKRQVQQMYAEKEAKR